MPYEYMMKLFAGIVGERWAKKYMRVIHRVNQGKLCRTLSQKAMKWVTLHAESVDEIDIIFRKLLNGKPLPRKLALEINRINVKDDSDMEDWLGKYVERTMPE
jgi:hypothetical protein